MQRLRGLLVLLWLWHVAPGHAAQMVLVNTNLPGQGLNDATPRMPEGGNPGTTLGQLRLHVVQAALEQWAAQLHSEVPIRVQVRFAELFCSPDDATLGAAGALGAAANFPLAPQPNRAYPMALANALARADLNPSGDDIQAQFNSLLDSSAACLGGGGWWYGTDPAVPVPAGKIALLPVVFHELAHGLGFQSLVSTETGTPFTVEAPRFTDFLFDVEAGLPWSQMSDAQRLASQVNDPDLVWHGARTNSSLEARLGFEPRVAVTAPAAIVGAHAAQRASFGKPLPHEGLSGTIVIADDGSGSVRDACQPLVNAGAMAGHIALIERGSCDFVVKVSHAQAAGAIAVLVYHNQPQGLPGMGGNSGTLDIPSLGISQALGQAILAQAESVHLQMAYDPARMAGTQLLAGSPRVRMHAPSPVEPGSSVSHFAPEAFPDLLMEPSLTTRLFNELDLTLEVFRDLGWQTEVLLRNGVERAPLQ